MTAKRKPSFSMSKEDFIDSKLCLIRSQFESQGYELKQGYHCFLGILGKVLSVESLSGGRIKVQVQLQDSGPPTYRAEYKGQVVEITCPNWHFRTWDPDKNKRAARAAKV
jgi:hypothetical protein